MNEAIILAGGLGTRLRSVVPDRPKPMALVAGRPFLEILLASLRMQGFNRAVLSLGYMSESVVSYFGGQYHGMELDYAIESEPLGTGGAIKLALSHCISDHAYIFNGDTYLDLEIDALRDKWRADQAPIIVARQVDDTTRYGRIIEREGRIVQFGGENIGGKGLINAGCYVLPTRLFEGHLPSRRFSFEGDFLPDAVQRDRFDVFISLGSFIDIGVPEDYHRAQVDLRDIAR